MNIVRTQRPILMGSFMETLSAAASNLFAPKGGQIIETPGAPAVLNMTIVGVLAAAVVAVAVMKKKKVL